MGLNVSHDAWNGPYSMFHHWRIGIARALGLEVVEGRYGLDYELPDDPAFAWGLDGDSIQGHWNDTPEEPLMILLAHSDCDGKIEPEHALLLAKRLEEIRDEIAFDGPDADWLHGQTEEFIAGALRAGAAGEPLVFG